MMHFTCQRCQAKCCLKYRTSWFFERNVYSLKNHFDLNLVHQFNALFLFWMNFLFACGIEKRTLQTRKIWTVFLSYQVQPSLEDRTKHCHYGIYQTLSIQFCSIDLFSLKFFWNFLLLFTFVVAVTFWTAWKKFIVIK